jgi:hypothetical protein
VRLLAVSSLLPGLACGGDEELPPGSSRPSYCNPLSEESWCLLPWPSSFFLSRDASTRTGYRVSYSRQATPKNESGIPVDPTRFNTLDGFPVASQIVVAFRGGVSPQGLPGPEALAASVEAQSPIWLLEMKSGTRVPFFAEVDLAAPKGDEPAGLIIRPQVALAWNSRYAVAVRSSLRNAAGGPLEPPEGFRRVRDRLPLDPVAKAEAARLEEVISALESRGLPRSELVLAWDFHTASEEAVTGPLLRMVDETLAAMPPAGPPVEVKKSVDHAAAAAPPVLRTIEGTFEVQSYLQSDDPESWLNLDATGQPKLRGRQRFPFMAIIPRCAEQATAPLPFLIYGHGLFGSMRDLELDYTKGLADRLCMVMVATNWIGVSEDDLGAIPTGVLLDFSKLPRITDRLLQAHVNAQALVRLARGGLAAATSLQIGGKPVADGSQLYYLGISNGGIQGATMAALSPDLTRLVLNVPGAWWSLMMQRSSNFALLAILLENVYTSALDRLLLMSLTQHLWDATDPINFASRALRAPLAGRKPKRILLQEAKDDDQVPNLATRTLVRGLGLDGLASMVEPVFGVKERSGPLDSAYVQWNLHVNPIPAGNKPPPKPDDAHSSHKLLRLQESCISQIQAFLKPDGKVESTCEGACDPS